jgi:hypothetical protein
MDQERCGREAEIMVGEAAGLLLAVGQISDKTFQGIEQEDLRECT